MDAAVPHSRPGTMPACHQSADRMPFPRCCVETMRVRMRQVLPCLAAEVVDRFVESRKPTGGGRHRQLGRQGRPSPRRKIVDIHLRHDVRMLQAVQIYAGPKGMA